MPLSDKNGEGNKLKELDSKDFLKIHEKAEKIGYADGIASGSDSVFQLGFDKGYADGLHTGLTLEKYRSFSQTISNCNNSPSDLSNEAAVFKSMDIPATTNSEHFQYTKHQNESIEEISKQQQFYCEKQLQEFEEKLPNTNNLFSLKN